MKSLVADDVLVIRKLLHRTLEKYGVCDQAVSGKEAVAMFIDAHKKEES